jgi:hypothetical protein
MKSALITLCLIVGVLSSPLPAGERGSTEVIFGQAPSLDENGIFNAALSDRTCNPSSAQTLARAHAVASPGYDGAPLSFRVNEVEVWGIYKAVTLYPGTPPTEDSFTVRVHGGFALPSPEVCSRSGTVGTREIVETVLGFDIYRHTLRLPSPCVVTAPSGRVWWIEVFNDTGSADDWYWLGGHENFNWPPDCCWDYSSFGTRVDLGNAPGVSFGPVFAPLAFMANIIDVGEAQGLRLSKPSNDELLLQWDGDCGGGGDYSVYRGSLAAGLTSLAPEPGLCDVSGRSTVVPAGEGTADFFLVAPWVAACAGCDCDPAEADCRSQGSYGADSDGNARPIPASHCYWQTTQQMHECAP